MPSAPRWAARPGPRTSSRPSSAAPWPDRPRRSLPVRRTAASVRLDDVLAGRERRPVRSGRAERHGSVRHGAAHLRPRERVRRHLHAPRPAPAQPRRGRPLPVPPGRVVGPRRQRVPRQRRPPLPRRRQPPRVRHPRVRLDPRPRHPRQGGRAHPRAAAGLGRAAAARGGHPRRHLPVQEQHRLGRQQLRLPRELPDLAARRLRALRRGAHPVLRVAGRSTPGPARCCRRPGAPCTASPSGPSTSGRACPRPRPAAGRSSTPATSPTPTPSATGGCTSSSATRT